MDAWARVVDWCEDATRMTMWRGAVAVTAGSYRATAASTNEVGSWAGDDARTNGYAEAIITTLAVSTSEVGVALRIVSSTQHYICSITQAGVCNIWQYNTAFVSLATVTITLPTLPFSIGADIVDSTIRMWVNNKIVLVSNGATVITGPGVAGIYIFAVTAVANVEVTRWEAGPVIGPPSGRHNP